MLDEYLSPLGADIIGMIGGLFILIGYGYNVYAKRSSPMIYNGVNLIGGICLILSLLVHFNLASLVLNIIWVGIAMGGLWKTWPNRQKISQS